MLFRSFKLENHHATGFAYPEESKDQKKNIRLKEGHQKDGVTAFVFEKKNSAACLKEQVNVATESWQWFIYAFSQDNTFAQHGPGENGKSYVRLGDGKTISVNEIRDVSGSKNFVSVNRTAHLVSDTPRLPLSLGRPSGNRR